MSFEMSRSSIQVLLLDKDLNCSFEMAILNFHDIDDKVRNKFTHTFSRWEKTWQAALII